MISVNEIFKQILRISQDSNSIALLLRQLSHELHS